MLGDLIPRVLGKTFAGLEVKIWLAIAVFLAGVAFVVIQVADNAVEDTLDTAKDAGAAEAVIEEKNQTLDQLGDANDAEQDLRGERNADRYSQCLSDSRDKSRCERYRPL